MTSPSFSSKNQYHSLQRLIPYVFHLAQLELEQGATSQDGEGQPMAVAWPVYSNKHRLLLPHIVLAAESMENSSPSTKTPCSAQAVKEPLVVAKETVVDHSCVTRVVDGYSMVLSAGDILSAALTTTPYLLVSAILLAGSMEKLIVKTYRPLVHV